MNCPLFLFCGGPAIDDKGRPKSLMKIQEGRSLLIHHLMYLKLDYKTMPLRVNLLCDDGQDSLIKDDIKNLTYPIPIDVTICGKQPNTFEKFCRALYLNNNRNEFVQFGYPDIFSFDELTEVKVSNLNSKELVYISAAPLTSRFPRLIIDVYNNKVKGISNYTSPVPANPMYVFGGNLWGSVDCLSKFVEEFLSQTTIAYPSLEYDFFFWLINNNKMNCVILHGKRLWIDSRRDVNQLNDKKIIFF